MNIASLLTGDIGAIGGQLASNMLQNVLSGNSAFSKIMGKLEDGSQVNINEMNLSQEELNKLNEVREFAMNKGLSEIEVMLDGNKFVMDVKHNSLTAVVS